MGTFLGVLGAVIVFMVLLSLSLVAYGLLAIRNQRHLLARLRENGLAYLCRTKNGLWRLAASVVAVDEHEVSLWTCGVRQPKRKVAFWSFGAVVAPEDVRLKVGVTVPGLAVTSADGESVRVAIYPDPSARLTVPTREPLIGLVIDEIQRFLHHTAR